MIYNKESNSDITSDFTVMKFNKEIAKKAFFEYVVKNGSWPFYKTAIYSTYLYPFLQQLSNPYSKIITYPPIDISNVKEEQEIPMIIIMSRKQ